MVFMFPCDLMYLNWEGEISSEGSTSFVLQMAFVNIFFLCVFTVKIYDFATVGPFRRYVHCFHIILNTIACLVLLSEMLKPG